MTPETDDEPVASPEPAAVMPFSVAYFDTNIQAAEQVAQQQYEAWQQTLGALNVMRQMRALAQKGG